MKSLNRQLQQILETPDRELASLATVVFAANEISYEGYFGARYINPLNAQQNLPVTHDSKFRIASISKLVATIGLMQQVEAGKLDLDVDISRYFDFELRNPHHPNIPITIRMLLSHTSSLRDGGEHYSLPIPYTISDFFEPQGAFYHNGIHWAAASEPPGFFYYCNLNFGLIGTLIELASELRFDQYMQGHVFRPLGIEASYNVRDFSDKALAHIAPLYRKTNEDGSWNSQVGWRPQVDDYRGIRPDQVIRVENPNQTENPDTANRLTLADYIIGSNGTLFSPQGGLRISAVDLAKIGMLLANSGTYDDVRLLQPNSVEAMFTPSWRYTDQPANGDNYNGLMRQWGLGVQIITDASAPQNGDRLVQDTSLAYVGHAGDAYGLLSGLWFNPENKVGFVYLIGGVGSDPNQYLGEYSAFSRWEEQIMTALYRGVIKPM